MVLLCQGEFFNIFDLGYFGPQGAVVDDVISATSSIWSSIVGVWNAKVIANFGLQICKVIYKLRLSRRS